MAKAKSKLPTLIILGIVGFAGFNGYNRFVVPWQEGDNFAGKALNDFGRERLDLPAAEGADREKPYRRGKVLIIIADKRVSDTSIIGARLHPAWYSLPAELRARRPAEVRTLVRRRMGDGESRLYVKGLRSKNVSSRDVTLNVYDWVDKVYVGSVVLDPGQYTGDIMEEEDLNTMMESIDSGAIVDAISRMPRKR